MVSKQQSLVILLHTSKQTMAQLVAAGYSWNDMQTLFEGHVNVDVTTDATTGDIYYALST